MWRLEVQDQYASRVGRVRAVFQATDFQLYLHMAERDVASSLASSYKGTGPIQEGSTPVTDHFPTVPFTS